MAGVAGNVYTLAYAKQSAKGTAASVATGYKDKLAGNSAPEPDRQIIQLEETDATRQQGSSVVVGSRVSGTSEHYVRPESFGLLAHLLLGSTGDSGGGPYTHVSTFTQSTPYATLWKNIGAGVIIDRYTDCRISSLTLRGSAGGALMTSVEWRGRDAIVGAATDNSQSIVTEAPLVYPQFTATIGGSAPGTVENFEVTIDNGGDFIQADSTIFPYDYVLGRLAITGTFTILFEDNDAYQSFHAGSSSATALSSTLFSQTLNFTATASASSSVSVALGGGAYTAYPVNPDPSGAPIRVAAAFRALPQTTAAGYVSITTVNSVASY